MELIKYLVPFLFSILAVVIPIIFNFIIKQKKINLEVLKLNTTLLNDRNNFVNKYLSVFSLIITDEYKNKVSVDIDVGDISFKEIEVKNDENRSYYNTLKDLFELLNTNIRLLNIKGIKLFIKLSKIYNNSYLNAYYYFKNYVDEIGKANEYLLKSMQLIINKKNKINHLLKKIQINLMNSLVKFN